MDHGEPIFSDDGEAYYLPVDPGTDEGEPQWLVVTSAPPHDEEMLSFRLAQPAIDADGEGKIAWYYAGLTSGLPADAISLAERSFG